MLKKLNNMYHKDLKNYYVQFMTEEDYNSKIELLRIRMEKKRNSLKHKLYWAIRLLLPIKLKPIKHK